MKALGAGAVLLAAFSLGLLLRRERQARLEALRSLAEALRMMSGELALRKPAMPELLNWMSKQSEGSAAEFFRRLSFSLSRLGEKSFASLWQECADLSLTELNASDKREFRQLGALLGRFELTRQLAGLESCALRMDERLRREEQRYQGERKLLLALPVSAGCLLVLLFW